MLGGAAPSSWSVSLTPFAHPAVEPVAVEGSVAPMFILASAIFNQAALMFSVLTEKETGVRAYLERVGLLTSAYWIPWWVFEACVALYNAGLVLAFAFAFRLELFTKNDLGLVLLLNFLAFLAITSFGYGRPRKQ